MSIPQIFAIILILAGLFDILLAYPVSGNDEIILGGGIGLIIGGGILAFFAFK